MGARDAVRRGPAGWHAGGRRPERRGGRGSRRAQEHKWLPRCACRCPRFVRSSAPRSLPRPSAPDRLNSTESLPTFCPPARNLASEPWPLRLLPARLPSSEMAMEPLWVRSALDACDSGLVPRCSLCAYGWWSVKTELGDLIRSDPSIDRWTSPLSISMRVLLCSPCLLPSLLSRPSPPKHSLVVVALFVSIESQLSPIRPRLRIWYFFTWFVKLNAGPRFSTESGRDCALSGQIFVRHLL